MIYGRAMRIWLAIALVVVGCKKNAETPSATTTAGSQAGSAAASADAAATVAVAPAPDAAAAPAPIDEDKLLETEAIGPLKIGMVEADAIKALGAPKTKSKVIEEGATGSFVSDWTFDGAALHMAADKKKGPFKVASISVTKPPHATARGIKVGSTLAELINAYPRTVEDGSDPNMFLVGSIYGGLLFKLEKAVVTEIFLGAMAE